MVRGGCNRIWSVASKRQTKSFFKVINLLELKNMHNLDSIIIVPFIFYFTYKFLEALIRRKERLMLVEKLDLSNLHTFPSSQEALNVLEYMPNKCFSNLRIGLLIAGIGLGLMVAWVLAICFDPFGSMSSDYRGMFEVIYLASPALFGGIGLLISYLIEQKARKEGKK